MRKGFRSTRSGSSSAFRRSRPGRTCTAPGRSSRGSLTASGRAVVVQAEPALRTQHCRNGTPDRPRKPVRRHERSPGSYQRWRAADESGRDDDADWAFKTVFRTVVPERAGLGRFHERGRWTRLRRRRSATRAARATRARQSCPARSIGGAAAAVLRHRMGHLRVSRPCSSVFSTWSSPSSSGSEGRRDGRRVLVGDGEPRSCRGGVCGGSEGDGRDPRDPGVAIAALFALQRLLGSDRESFE